MTKDKLKDFRNPKKLKAFFEEMDIEFGSLNRDRHAEINALEMALMALLTALDDQLPAPTYPANP